MDTAVVSWEGLEAFFLGDASKPETGQPRTQNILLVDDEEDILSSLKTLFEVSVDNVKVHTAESGMAGLDILKKVQVDLIITDFKMPGMNGLEFLAEAKAVAPSTQRILITAFPDLNIAIQAINEADIENFITKPLQPEKVVQVVDDVLRARRAKVQRDQSFARSLDLLRKKSQKPP
jgi:YesN/AraC family two-component response regulator